MKKDNTGFRNGDLFCFNCGTAQKIPFPIRVDLASEWMKAFAKLHKNCKPTWKEPQPNPDTANSQMAIFNNLSWWRNNGEHGISSKTMVYYFTGTKIGDNFQESHPHDPDDFRRCHLLLEAVPQWRKEMDKLRDGGPTWSLLVENWDKLTEMLKEQMRTKKPNGMYEFMQTLIAHR